MQSVASASLPKVIIVGGGIGGLTAALALLKRGIDVMCTSNRARSRRLELAFNSARMGPASCTRSASRTPWPAFRSSAGV